MPHIYHLLAPPKESQLVLSDMDLDAKTTTLTTFTLSGHALTPVHSTTVEGVLRRPQATQAGLVAPQMPVWKPGEPVVFETWSWDFESCERREMRCGRLALMGFVLDIERGVMLLDRQFPEDGPNSALVCDWETLEPRGKIPLNSNLVSPVFDGDGKRLALVHTDQGGVEVKIYSVAPDEVALVCELDQTQIQIDMDVALVAFAPHDELLLWARPSYSGKATLGAYSCATGKARFVSELDGDENFRELCDRDERFQDEDGDNLIFNTVGTMAVLGERAFVGGTGEVFEIMLADGKVTKHAMPTTPGVITRVVACGETIVALDHDGNVAPLTR